VVKLCNLGTSFEIDTDKRQPMLQTLF